MTKVTRITASPRAAATGAAVTVRLAGGGHRKPYYDEIARVHYRAGVVAMTRLSASIEFDQQTGTGWTGAVVPTTGVIAWAPSGGTLGSAKADLAAMAAYYWPNAAIVVSDGDEDVGVYTTRLTAKVADAQVQNHQLSITIADLSVGLSQPLLTARFGGTGGIDGDASAANRIKRRSWGRVFNIEGRVLNAANNIYEFGDPAFPWQSFDTVRDVGRDASPACAVLAWQGSIAATLTALEASAPARGSGVVAPSIACVKWWTQPVGPLSADIHGEIGAGYVETCPEIAAAILTAVGGPAVTNVAAMKALRSGPAGIHVDEGENINSALNRLLFGTSVYWKLNADTGTITLYEFTFSAPVETIASDNAERTKTLPPVKTRRVGYKRAYRVHSDGEIAASLLVLGLSADAEAFTFTDGVADNPAQVITFTATGLDSGEVVNFTTSPAVALTGAGLTRQLTLANFGSNKQVTVTATGATSGATGTKTVTRQDKSTAAAGATADVALTALDGNSTVSGNQVVKTSAAGYNTSIIADKQPLNGYGQVTFRWGSNNPSGAVGLYPSAVPPATKYNIIGWYGGDNGNVYWNDGGTGFTLVAAASTSDVYSIVYDGQTVFGYRNGQPVALAATVPGGGANQTLYLQMAPYEPQTFVQGLKMTTAPIPWNGSIVGQNMPANYAGSNFKLAPFGSFKMVLVGNRATMTDNNGNSAYGGGAYTYEVRANTAHVTFRIPIGNIIAGLCAPANQATATWDVGAYSINNNANGNIYAYEGASAILIGANGGNEVLVDIVYDGQFTRYYLNGATSPARTVAASAGQVLGFKAVWNADTPNTAVYDVVLGYYGENVVRNSSGTILSDPQFNNSSVTMSASGVLNNGVTSSPQIDATLIYNGSAEGGADKTSNQQIVVAAPDAMAIACDYQGNPATGQLPAVSSMPMVTKGGTSVRVVSTTSFSATFNNCTGSIDNGSTSSTKGQVTISTITSNSAWVDIAVTVNGLAIPIVRMSVSKKLGDAPQASQTSGGTGTGPSSNSDTIDSTASSTYVVGAGPFTVRAGASGKINLSVNTDYDLGGLTTGSSYMVGKFQIRPVGGTMADVGLEQQAATAAQVQNSTQQGQYLGAGDITTYPGNLSFTRQATSLTAGNDYEIQLLIRSTAGRTIIPYDSAYGTAA